MMHGKAIWKSWNLSPSCKGQCADAHWVMAYRQKIQSFMKNRGQQKCLDKALHGEQPMCQITMNDLIFHCN